MGCDCTLGDGDDAGAKIRGTSLRNADPVLTPPQTFGYYAEYQSDSIYTKGVVAIVWWVERDIESPCLD